MPAQPYLATAMAIGSIVTLVGCRSATRDENLTLCETIGLRLGSAPGLPSFGHRFY